jgi:hypothetical protein
MCFWAKEMSIISMTIALKTILPWLQSTFIFLFTNLHVCDMSLISKNKRHQERTAALEVLQCHCEDAHEHFLS